MEPESLTPDEEQVLKEILGEASVSDDASLDDLRERSAEDFALADTLFGRSAKLPPQADAAASSKQDDDKSRGLHWHGKPPHPPGGESEPAAKKQNPFSRLRMGWLIAAAIAVLLGLGAFLIWPWGKNASSDAPLLVSLGDQQSRLTQQVRRMDGKTVLRGANNGPVIERRYTQDAVVKRHINGVVYEHPYAVIPLRHAAEAAGPAGLLDDASLANLAVLAHLLTAAKTQNLKIDLEMHPGAPLAPGQEGQISQFIQKTLEAQLQKQGAANTEVPPIARFAPTYAAQITAAHPFHVPPDLYLLLVRQE